ncbi:MAG: hypothetical protein ACQCN3_04155 [Candidatus Bathyarchaeia archaeon]
MNQGKMPTTYQGLPHVRISLLARNGLLPKRSGLNWGQRPEYNRNPNEAYIRVPKNIDDLNFFPDTGTPFVLQTDDGQKLRVTREQSNSKAITTYENNGVIGEYFRKRLGLVDGALVKKADLVRYGRTDIDFYKVNKTTYILDFHV